MIESRMLKLHITPAEGDPFEYVVDVDSLVIGRSSRCDLAVADRCLSRQHLRLFQEDGQWMVEDLGSRNGTRINGVLISKPAAVRVLFWAPSVLRKTRPVAGGSTRIPMATCWEASIRLFRRCSSGARAPCSGWQPRGWKAEPSRHRCAAS